MKSSCRWAGVLVAGVVPVLLLGCGAEEPAVRVQQSPAAQETQPAQERSAAPAPAAAAPSPAPAETAPASDTAAPPAAAADPSAPQAIAVEDHRVSGVQVALTELRRTSGDTVTLRLQFRNTTDDSVSDSVFYGTGLADQTYLIDGASKKKYLVVRDAENNPVGSVGSTSTIRAGATLPVWVRFPAPPAEITSVTVVVPGAPPFEDVPIK